MCRKLFGQLGRVFAPELGTLGGVGFPMMPMVRSCAGALVLCVIALAACERYAEPDLDAFHNLVRSSAVDADSDAGSRAAMAALVSATGSRRVVAVGESSHGAHEFFTTKDQIFRTLVRERSFTVLALEVGLPEAIRINDYVVDGKGDAESAVGRLRYWTSGTEELVRTVEWMRSVNSVSTTRRKLKVYGFDMQLTEKAAEDVQEFLGQVDQVAASRYANLLTRLNTMQPNDAYKGLSGADIESIGEQIAALNKEFETNVEWRAVGFDRFDVVKREARVLAQSYRYFNGPNRSPWFRDEMMAENVEWIRAREGENVGILISAFNGHIAHRQPRKMGTLVREANEDDYFAIALFFRAGKVRAYDAEKKELTVCQVPVPHRGSLEAELAHAGPKSFFLPLTNPSEAARRWLSRVRDQRAIGSTWFGEPNSYRSSVPGLEFDAVIFIDKVGPSTPLRTVE